MTQRVWRSCWRNNKPALLLILYICATVLHILCYIYSVTYTVSHIQCYIHCVTYTVLHIQCYIYSVTYTVLHIQCYIYCVTYTVLHILCYIYSVTYTVSHIQCHIYCVHCQIVAQYLCLLLIIASTCFGYNSWLSSEGEQVSSTRIPYVVTKRESGGICTLASKYNYNIKIV